MTWQWPWPVLSMAFTLIQYLRLTFESVSAEFGPVWVKLAVLRTKMLKQFLPLTWPWPDTWPCKKNFKSALEPSRRDLSNPASPVSLRSLVWELAWGGRYTPPPPPGQWRSAETPVKRGLIIGARAGTGTFCPEPEPEPPISFTWSRSRIASPEPEPEPEPTKNVTAPHPWSLLVAMHYALPTIGFTRGTMLRGPS